MDCSRAGRLLDRGLVYLGRVHCLVWLLVVLRRNGLYGTVRLGRVLLLVCRLPVLFLRVRLALLLL